MTSIINADSGISSSVTGITFSADNSGALNIQTNGVTAIAISSSQAVSFPATTSLNFGSANITTLTSSSATITNLIATSASITTLTNNPTFGAGTANGMLYLNGSKVITSGSAVVFDGTNMGVGVTPSSWTTVFPAVQLGGAGTFFAAQGNSTPALYLGTNAHYNGTNWIYKVSNVATRYDQDTGVHRWYNAPSGTAGNNITFTQAMTLDANGDLGVGTTNPTSYSSKTFQLNGSSTTAAIKLTNSTTGEGDASGFDLESNGNDINYVNRTATGVQKFWTNSTERARITSDGSFGIGTTTVSNLLQVAGAIGLNHSAMTSAATSGDFTITVGGLQSLAAGNAWYVTSVLVFYVGIDGDQTDGNLLVTALYLRGLSTWGLQSTTNIVGTATVTGANATATSLDLTFDVSNDNLGSVYALVLGGNGGSRPTISIAG